MSKKNLKSKASIFKKYHTLILLPLGTVFLLTFCVVIFGLGLDSKFFDSTLSGYIFDRNKSPIVNAKVCIDEICVNTFENGFYELKDLDLGNNEIKVITDRYLDVTQSIKISNGENSFSLELTEASLANVTIKFSDLGGLKAENLNFKLESEDISNRVNMLDNSSLELKLFEKKTGLYKLHIQSEYYVDETIDLIVEPDIDNKYEITLEPASTIKIYVTDWLSSQPISKVTLNIGKEMEFETDDLGMVNLEELSIYENELYFTKEDYLKHKYTLSSITPGINPDLHINLTPEGKITFVKDTALGKQIFLSNFDGSELRQLTLEGNNSNPWIDSKNEKVFYLKSQPLPEENDPTIGVKPGLVYWVDFLGEETKLISSEKDHPVRMMDLINYEKDIRIYTSLSEGTSKIMKTKLDDTGETTIYESMGSNIQDLILSPDANKLIFTINSTDSENQTNDGVYTTTLKFNRTVNLLKYNSGQEKRNFIPRTINKKEDVIVLTLDNEAFVNYNSRSGIERITNDKFEKYSFDFQNSSNNISFIRNSAEKKELLLINPETKELQTLVETNAQVFDYDWLSESIFTFITDGELWISTIDNLDSPKLVNNSVIL